MCSSTMLLLLILTITLQSLAWNNNLTTSASKTVQLNKCCDYISINNSKSVSCGISGETVYNFSSKLFQNLKENLTISIKFHEAILPCENRTELTLNISELVNPTGQWVPGYYNFTRFTTDGKFIHLQNTYDSDEFCISSISNEELSVSFCNQTCSPKRPCITRCCDYGTAWDFSSGKLKCIPSGQKDWTPFIYSSIHDYSPLSNEQLKNDGIRPILISNHARRFCKNYVILSKKKPIEDYEKHVQQSYKILEDGSVWLKLRRRQWIQLRDGYYCIDGVVNFAGENKSIETGYSGLEEDNLLFDCDPKRQDPEGYTGSSSILYGVVLLASSIFLIITATVFILLKEKQTVHGWTSLGYVVAMIVNFHTLAFNQFSALFMVREASFKDPPYFTFCAFNGMLGNFAFIASFVWLTMMNFDIWWTFRTLKPSRKSLKRFWIYMIIAFFVPSVLVGTGITLDLLYRNDPFSDIIIPDYGRNRCYMERRLAPLPYIYGPVSVMLGINLIFYVSTVISIYKTKKSTDFATTSSTKTKQSGQSLKLFAKLLFIMGIPWIWDVYSWATAQGDAKDIPWYIVLGDTLTMFQSILVFIIFVWKKETKNSLMAKYPRFKGFVNTVTKFIRRLANWTQSVNPCCRRLAICGLKTSNDSEMHTGSTIATTDSKTKSKTDSSSKAPNLNDSYTETSKSQGSKVTQNDQGSSEIPQPESIEMKTTSKNLKSTDE